MASFKLEDPVKHAFNSATASQTPPDIRLLLIQTSESGKSLTLSGTYHVGESDKEDYQPLLTKAFGQEPSRSGYALYRLDTQAANGDWEWLCIAYQPESAKVREKMQYVKTRSALMDGLREQYFIETIYATSPADFHFPTKLRNARKHDYQNPQMKTMGKPASEAAGADAGGAKRNFGQFAGKPTASLGPNKAYQASTTSTPPPAHTIPPAQSTANVSASAEKSVSPTESTDAAPNKAVHNAWEDVAHTSAAPPPKNAAAGSQAGEASPVVASQSTEDEQTAVEDCSRAATDSGAPLERIAAIASTQGATGEQTSEEIQEREKEDEAGPIAPSAVAHLPATEFSSEQLAQARKEGDVEATPAVEDRPDAAHSPLFDAGIGSADVAEQAEAETKAPEEPPSRAPLPSESSQELSQPLVPSAQLAKEQLHDPTIPTAKAKWRTELGDESAPASGGERPKSQKQTTGSKYAIGESSNDPSQGSRSGSRSNGDGGRDGGRPPSTFTSYRSYAWEMAAEAALSGLARASAEHNYVVLGLLPSSSSSSPHQVELKSPPRFLPPGDLSPALQSDISESEEVTFAFYRYPVEVEERKVVCMYVEVPRGATSAQKTFYANSLEPIRLKAAELSGLEIERDSVDTSYGPFPRPTPEQAEEVSSRIESVRYRVNEATQAAGRPAPPRLVAISKLHPPSSILAAYVHTEQLHFGENYVQELVDKAKVLPKEIKWHFVGGLQSNKGKMLASIPNLYLLETLDSIKAANVLEKALSAPDALDREEPLRVYLQVNTSGEEVKSGLPPLTTEEVEEGSSKEKTEGDKKEEPLFQLAKHIITTCPHLNFSGLMTIGSAANSSVQLSAKSSHQEALDANPDFAKLYESRKVLVKKLRAANIDNASYPILLGGGGKGEVDVSREEEDGEEEEESEKGGLELSMGMTSDFPIAIAAGSDNLRIGTDCFGPRPGTREEAKKAMQGEIDMDVGSRNPLLGSGEEKGFAKPKRPGGKK